MRKTLSTFIVAVLTEILVGCHHSTDPTNPATSYPTYTFGFLNYSDDTLSEVELYMFHLDGKVEVGSAGSLETSGIGEGGKQAISAFASQYVPEQVIMRWVTPDRNGHNQTISLADAISDREHFVGTVWFRYQKDGYWHVIPLTQDQMIWRCTHGKNVAPTDPPR